MELDYQQPTKLPEIMVYCYWLIPEMLRIFVPLHVSAITETAKVKIQVCYDMKGVKAVETKTR